MSDLVKIFVCIYLGKKNPKFLKALNHQICSVPACQVTLKEFLWFYCHQQPKKVSLHIFTNTWFGIFKNFFFQSSECTWLYPYSFNLISVITVIPDYLYRSICLNYFVRVLSGFSVVIISELGIDTCLSGSGLYLN